MKDSPEARRERQRRFREEMKERGFVQTQVWVPENMKAEIRRIADSMRNDPDGVWVKKSS